MTEIKEQFIQVKTKANFENRLEAGDIKSTSIAFIEDTDLIWTQGKYYSVIPKEGGDKQVLTWKSSGEAKWEDLSNIVTNLEEILAYGVLFDSTVADPHLTRIGNMSMHKSLPIQSQLKGCIAQGSKIMYWLDESDWRFRKKPITQNATLVVSEDVYTLTSDIFNTLQYEKQWIKIDSVACQVVSIDTINKIATLLVNDELKTISVGEKTIEMGAVLNGYDGTVRVYCPAFYIKSETEGTVSKVWLSTVKIDSSYTYLSELLIDAYRSTVLNAVPENMGYLSTLAVNSAISVVNTNTYCRGGGNRSANDQYLTTDPFRTDLGKPRTAISRATMRTDSRKVDSQMLSYDQYKNIFYWLYVVEYANFNSQETYNATLTDEGYRQGGLGNGITNMGNWGEYNGIYPLTPCGYGNTLGNKTGVLDFVVPEFEYTYYSAWFNSWNVNSAACTAVNASNNSKNITSVKSIDNYAFSSGASNVWGTTTYVISGLTDGLSIKFKCNTEIATITEDGEYVIEWPERNIGGTRYATFDKLLDSCNINIYNKDRNSVILTVKQQTLKMPRWRGFDNPFGDIWTNLDGIIIKKNTGDDFITVYTCQDPEHYSDSITDYYTKTGEATKSSGYIKSFDLGNAAHIIPNAVGGSTTLYICDYFWACVAGPNTLLVGGRANHGSFSGLGSFRSNNDVGASDSYFGFRSVSFFLVVV